MYGTPGTDSAASPASQARADLGSSGGSVLFCNSLEGWRLGLQILPSDRYLTVVMDLDSGAVVFVGDGKKADALVPFWKRLRPSGAKIEAVAMDMSAAYYLAAQTHIPWAFVVFDHFHIIKLFNEKLSNLRRDLYRAANASASREVLL